MFDVIVFIFTLALAYTAPMLIISLGGLYSERSGVVNIGLEGLMGMGAFAAAITSYYTADSLGGYSIILALLVSVLGGMALSFFHAFACVSMNANQVISGTAINMLSVAVTVYFARALTTTSNIQLLKSLKKRDIPILSKIPIIGDLFFSNAYDTTYLVIAIVIISWYVLYKRPFGLRLRACGENPHAADSMGINVAKMRYAGVLISGGLAGLGGGIVILTYAKEFSELTYNGLGYLALAALIFGRWKPFGIIGSSLFFGIAVTIANISQVYDGLKDIPNIILNTFPYVITLIALVLFSKNSVGPKAAGEPYDVSKR